jgi:lipoyl(octanoyl) transferase
MEKRVGEIQNGISPPLVWLLEHPPLYTAGTSASEDHVLKPSPFPIYPTGRGGKMTYHGPGQRIIYLMLDLKAYKCDIRWYVHELEEWIIRVLASFGIKGERVSGQVGIWVEGPSSPQKKKIAALGIRVQKWVTLHGVSVNLSPNLKHFEAIIPCGLKGSQVTSFADLSCHVSPEDLDQALRTFFPF